MRPLLSICLAGVAGAAVAACSGEVGLVLTIDASSGRISASRIEVVLASPADGATETVDGQRIAPGALEAETVRYYRQQVAAGSVRTTRIDGFVVRIEPRDGADADEPFVPLLFAHDDDDGFLVGVGAILGEDGLPMAIDVPAGARLEATATMIPLAFADLGHGVLPGQGAEVACVGDAGPVRSGIVWRPPTGLEVRLLLPAPGEKSAATRPLDLDCDGRAANDDDCDDLRARYHAGAADTCDGEDTDCRGDKLAFEPCKLPPATCPAGDEGFRVCADAPGSTTACVEPPACRCPTGTCARCGLAFEGTPAAKVCAPAAGKLKIPACAALGPCTVEVVSHSSRWDVALGVSSAGPFGRRVTIDGEEVILLAKYISPQMPLPTLPGASLGDVHLAVTSGTAPEHFGIDLELGPNTVNTCADATDGATYKLVCLP